MSAPVVSLARDPFARCETVRQLVEAGASCRWCGQPARFRYGVSLDARPAPTWSPGSFCTVGCWRAYHVN